MNKNASPAPAKMKHVVIEGNIGAGKSTLLKNLQEYCSQFQEDHGLEFVQEPVSEWERIKDKDGKSILELMYEDPKKYCSLFQFLVLHTLTSGPLAEVALPPETGEDSRKVATLLHENGHMIECGEKGNITTRIYERSIYSAHYVFAKMLHDTDMISDIEYSVYEKMSEEKEKVFTPDLIIYLDVDAKTCFERIKTRNRKGEEHITLEYLERCEKYYGDMLQEDGVKDKVLRIDDETEIGCILERFL